MKSNRESSDWSWIYRSVSGDERRPKINKPWAQNGWIIGTDGHRLHMVKTDEKDGWFDMESSRVSDGFGGNEMEPAGVFNGLLPEVDEWKPISLSDLEETGRPDFKFGTLIMDGREVNCRYVTDAFDGSPQMLIGSKKGKEFDWNDPVFLKTKGGMRQALLMAIRPFDKKEWDKVKIHGEKIL